MSSPKRHVFISLLFILKCFSKPFIIRTMALIKAMKQKKPFTVQQWSVLLFSWEALVSDHRITPFVSAFDIFPLFLLIHLSCFSVAGDEDKDKFAGFKLK